MEEANKLIGAGKKQLVMGKPVEAVSTLQEACDMLAKKYGDTADECGEAFFWYGKALLDLARMENSVLGNALEGVPEEDEVEDKLKDPNAEGSETLDEKSRDELRVQVYDAMAEKKPEDAEKEAGADDKEGTAGEQQDTEKEGAAGEQNLAAEEKDKTETPGADNEGEEEQDTKAEKEEDALQKRQDGKTEESADKPENGQDEEEDEEGGDAEMEGDAEEDEGEAAAEKDSEDEEEVGNLQLAWEMFEVAKVIYKRRDAKEDQLMAAQAHLKLGEVSAESGNYTQALDDFQECLKLQLKHLDADSRLLAETHYQLGVTYSLNLQYSEAIQALNNSISVIRSRLDNLQQLLDKAEGPDALAEERKELEELKALLPEIQEKVEDASEGLKTQSAAAETVKTLLDGGSTSSESSGSAVNATESQASHPDKESSTVSGQKSSVPVSDISHLVRKKRKPEESPVKGAEVKKAKQDDGRADDVKTNGAHRANGETNGHVNMEVAK